MMALDGFESYKERTVEVGQVVEVYRNLHNGLLSIRDAKSKLVLGHAFQIQLKDAKFIVSKSGRERVLREGKKNVHAVIRGEIMKEFEEFSYDGVSGASYNPYKYKSFVDVATKEKVTCSNYVQIHNKGSIITASTVM